jgi:hypothetical protein
MENQNQTQSQTTTNNTYTLQKSEYNDIIYNLKLNNTILLYSLGILIPIFIITVFMKFIKIFK